MMSLDLTMGQKYMQHELRLTQDFVNMDIAGKIWARRGGYTMFYRKPEVQGSFTACPFEMQYSISSSSIHPWRVGEKLEVGKEGPYKR